LCPTNDDPEFDNRPRVKRTTGIPRSFLQKVDKSVVLAQTDGDETKRPSGIMVNAEGDFVIAEPDKASWEQFQAKAKSSATTNAPVEDKEIQEQGLECSIDKKMFIEPMKTPCCQKTFCNDCITNALIESDFVCPACQSEGVLIDDLQPDEDTSKKIQEYLKEKETVKSPSPSSPKASEGVKADGEDQDEPRNEDVASTEQKTENESNDKTTDSAKEKSSSPVSQAATIKTPPTGPKGLISVSHDANKQVDGAKTSDANSKKRPADDILDNPRIPKGPKAMQNQQNQQNMMNGMSMNGMSGMGMNMGMNHMMFNGMPMMPNMMGMPNMGNMNMGMPNMNMMGIPGMMGMPGFPGMNGGFGGMNGWDMGMNGMNGNMGNMNGGMNGFQNGNFGQGVGPDEDAYFRKPVNPHRHQNKQRRVRPSDYREL
jgi:protein MPE1